MMDRGPRRVERIMGTAIGIDVRDATVPSAAIDDAFTYLRAVDARFSPFRADSEVSRLADGSIEEATVSVDLREVLALCDELCRTSGGSFDARHHRSDGRVDPSGIVKGWSVETAALRLEAAGAINVAINAGGDIIARGEPEPGRGWRVGIRHPLDPGSVAAVLAVRDRAVATSGAYERGEHVRDPHTGRPASGLLSVTVVGPSLTWADAYATAAFAMGRPGIAWVAGHPGYDVLAITGDLRVIHSSGLDAALIRA